MNAISALYKTYDNALKNGLIDQTDKIDTEIPILPLYHAVRRSDGKNIVEITLDMSGKLVKAAFLPEHVVDSKMVRRIIFPITEDSITRTSSPAPHMLCDAFKYVTGRGPKASDKETNTTKASRHEIYLKQLGEWVDFDQQREEPHRYLPIIYRYVSSGDIFPDIVQQLFSGMQPVVENGSLEVAFDEGGNPKKTDFKEVFVTFRIESDALLQKDFTVTTDSSLHDRYIDYVKTLHAAYETDLCNLSGEETYCSTKHRGLLGTAKMVSVSNNAETYKGRFRNGDEIVCIGSETSEKAHNMLSYLIDNPQTATYLGDSTYLLVWFTDDIKNDTGMKITQEINPYLAIFEESDLQVENEEQKVTVVGSEASKVILDYLSGKAPRSQIKQDSQCYVMIIHLINKGRISIKYFRALQQAELYERVAHWYETTNWPFFNYSKGMTDSTPAMYRYADYIFGREEANRVSCKNDKLKRKTIERLIVCMIDKKPFPADLEKRMLMNLNNRRSYTNPFIWDEAVRMGCSIFKKRILDRQSGEEVSVVLDENNNNRSYLYGRLLAIYEHLEIAADNAGREKTTNAERLWTSFVHAPAKTLLTLTHKALPYQARLKKNKFGLYDYYEKLLTDVINKIHDTEGMQEFSNHALDEHFVFGYYAQKQKFYTKKEAALEEETSDDNVK